MPDLLDSLKQILALLEEEQEILAELSDPPSGAEQDTLSDVRTEKESCARAIAGCLSDDNSAFQSVLESLASIFDRDQTDLGFARIPDVFSVRHDIASYHRTTRPSPCCIIGPPMFPVRALCRWIMTNINLMPFEDLDCAMVQREGLTTFLSARRRLTGHSGRWLVHHFAQLDWGAQRAICDVASRDHIPLLIALEAEPYSESFTNIGDYNFRWESGVSSRLHKLALSKTACHVSRANVDADVVNPSYS